MKSTEPAKVISTIIRKPAGVESTLQATDDSAGNYESDAETQSRNRVCVMNAAEWWVLSYYDDTNSQIPGILI